MPDTPGSRTVLSAETSPQWRTGGTSRKGQHHQFGFNAALRRATDRSVYPVRVEVWLNLHGAFRFPQVDREDMDAVSALEQTIKELAAGRAILAAQVTVIGTRSYLLYTGDASFAQDLDSAIRSRVPDHAVQVRAMPDQQWSGYASVVKMARRSRAGMVILCLLPLLTFPIVRSHYGTGWAIGEALWLYSWIATLMVVEYRVQRRKRPPPDASARPAGWLASHSAWAFLYLACTFGSLLFFFVSVWLSGVVSPWIGLAIAIGAGSALTGALWLRQVRHDAAHGSMPAVR